MILALFHCTVRVEFGTIIILGRTYGRFFRNPRYLVATTGLFNDVITKAFFLENLSFFSFIRFSLFFIVFVHSVFFDLHLFVVTSL